MSKFLESFLVPIILAVAYTVVSACEKEYLNEIDYWNEEIDGERYDRIDFNAIHMRADLLANIQWTALEKVPKNEGSYTKGQVVTGVPYSSVREKDKFIGIDVSLHTFLSATNNPMSVLYTENIGKSPYHSSNCSSYYGTNCSAAVCYVLGLDMPWATSEVSNSPYFKLVNNKDMQTIRAADVLWKSGHEILIYDLMRDSQTDSLTSVTVFQSNEAGTTIRKYSYAMFLKYFDGMKIYRFMPSDDMMNQELEESLASIQSASYIQAVCPSRGDKSVYCSEDSVVVNIIDASCSSISIEKNGFPFREYNVDDRQLVLKNLPFGKYRIRGLHEGETIGVTEFEIVDTNVEYHKYGTSICVSYNSRQGNPVYVAICNIRGDRLITKKLMPTKEGNITISVPKSLESLYVKVYFKTDWGRVTNIPIKVQ